MPLQSKYGPGTGSIKSNHTARTTSTKSKQSRDGSGKFHRDGSRHSTRTPRDSIIAVEGPLHRRPMVSRSPGSFQRVGVYHLVSGFIAICCQIAVTVLVSITPDNVIIFHENSPNATGAGRASVGIVAGVMYFLVGLYGLYMARRLFSFPSDVLSNKLWCFNVLNGISVIASLLLFGASSFMAKSSACWYEDLPSSVAASTILAMSLLLTVISCFEICVGASGVFVR